MKILLDVRLKTLEGKDMRDQVIKEDKDGQPIKDEKGNFTFDRPPITLRRVCEQTLIRPTMDVDDRTGREKPIKEERMIELYDLLKRVHEAKAHIELDSKQVTLLKEMIHKKFPSSVLLVGRAFELLDPMGKAEEKDKK